MTITMSIVMDWLWQTTWQTALLAAVVGCMTWLLRRWISPGARQALWLLVFARLMMPALPASRFSIWGLYSPSQIQSERIETHMPHVGNVQPIIVPETTSNHDFIPPPRPSIFENPQVWLAIAWMVGALFAFGYTVVATLRFARAVHRAASKPDAITASLLEECCRHTRIKPPIAILSDQVATPALFGVFRPEILLPPRMISTLDRDSLQNVILHELQHLKRHHLAMDWLLTAIRAIHWFNPAAWWAHRQIRAARELICDQAVIKSLGNADASLNYGHTLLTIAGGALRLSEPALVAAFARDQKLLRERIETIARTGKAKYIAGLGILLVMILIMTFLTSPGKAQQDVPTSRPATTMPTNDVLKYPDNWPKLDAAKAKQNEANFTAADAALQAALDRPLPEVRLDNVAFTDVVDFLRDVSGIKVDVNWQAIEKAGGDRNALVTARMKDVKFSIALKKILDDVGGGNVKLVYAVNNGVLTISAADDLSLLPTRVYDVRDLVANTPDNPKQQQELTGQIVKTIEEGIAPDSWEDNGGKGGKIRVLDGSAQLIVTQTAENQRKIAQMLDQLRETRATKIQLNLQILEVPAPSAAQIEQHFDKDAQIFIDDKAAREYAAAPGVRVLGQPSLTSFNGQQIVFAIDDGQKESLATRIQATVSADRKYVTVTPWMIYSPNARISADLEEKLDAIGAEFTDARIKTLQAKTMYGAKHPAAQNAQMAEDAIYVRYRSALDDSNKRLNANTDKPAEKWLISQSATTVPNGATLLVRQFKHSIIQTKPDGTTESTDAPPGDKVIWLLVRPTIIIQVPDQRPILYK